MPSNDDQFSNLISKAQVDLINMDKIEIRYNKKKIKEGVKKNIFYEITYGKALKCIY
jgi:hypothetical protein